MAERRILNSWKEIANYLGRGVRTVQRWEAQLGLPVHRPAGKDHSAVLAFSSELDNWLDRRPLRNSSHLEVSAPTDGVVLQSLLARTELLLQRCEILLLRNDELSRRFAEIVEILSDEQVRRSLGKDAARQAEAGAA